VRVSKALVAAFVLVLAATPASFAETRIPIRPTPKPGEVIHVTAGQEILLRSGENPEEPGPAQMHNKNVVVYTQKNGTFDAQGHLEAQVTVERLELDESFGGRQRPVPDTASLKGRVLAITFDRTGKLLGIKVPPDMRDFSSRLTQLLAGAYGVLNFVPAADLAVGEETTSTTELPMRLPGSAAAQGPLEARTHLTLRAIDRKGTDRIARLQQRIDVATTTGVSWLQPTRSGRFRVLPRLLPARRRPLGFTRRSRSASQRTRG
jgi:hypothetical protein